MGGKSKNRLFLPFLFWEKFPHWLDPKSPIQIMGEILPFYTFGGKCPILSMGYKPHFEIIPIINMGELY